jgi:RHS repeat-associated protein
MSCSGKLGVFLLLWLGVGAVAGGSPVLGVTIIVMTLLWLAGRRKELPPGETPQPVPPVPGPQPVTPGPPTALKAAFTATPSAGPAPLEARFDASASTAPAGIVSYAWDFGDGVRRDTGARATVRHRFRQAGEFRVTLTVTGQDGATAKARRTLTVRAPALLPAPADVRAVPGEERVTVTWSPVDGAAAYVLHWAEGDRAEGGEPERAEDARSPFEHTGLAGGVVHRYAVSAVGGEGEGPLSAWVEASPSAPNAAPRAAFEVSKDEATPMVVQFDASASTDSDGRVVAWDWDFGDGQQGSGAKAAHAYVATGRYAVSLTITDDRGATAGARRTVTVSSPPAMLPAPRDLAALPGKGSAELRWSAVPGAASYAVQWAPGDDPQGPGGAREAVTEPRFARLGLAPGARYAFRVAGVDARGEGAWTAPATVVPAAANTAPSAAFRWAAAAGAPLGVEVDGSASADPDGRVVRWAWDFGDGARGEGSTARHAYAAPGAYGVTLTVTDDDGASASAGQTVQVAAAAPPPDSAAVAPAHDPTVATDFARSVEFLYSGPNPVQTGVKPGAIDPLRAAVLRGLVTGRDGAPLAGVRVSTPGAPEHGATLSRADGAWDLAVNGGAQVTVAFEREGLLPARRSVTPPTREYTWLPPVALVAADTAAATVRSGAPEAQVARGSEVEDEHGKRRPSVLFPAGVKAAARLADGTVRPLDTLTVRATEYTVGPNGPAAMPDRLPPSSAYTYAVELSVDEAGPPGSASVEFDRPVIHYVENFLGFRTGGVVPVGWYDAPRGAWVPSDNGRVVSILAVEGGAARLDLAGGGKAASEAELRALGVSADELRHLGAAYAAGQSLWRVPIPHFTAWDCNWPYAPPPGARDPSPPRPRGEDPEPHPDHKCGSTIQVQNQALGEWLPVDGAPLRLCYLSSRVPGRRSAWRLDVPLGADLPPGVRTVELEILVAGQRHAWSLEPRPGLVHTFDWDGRDAYGRVVHGAQVARVRTGYTYGAVYQEGAELDRSFAQFSGVATVVQARQQVTLWQERTELMGTWDARGAGLGGWTLDVHHVFDPTGRVLYLGDGSFRTARSLADVITTVAGSGVWGDSGDGGPATKASLRRPTGSAVGPDGSLYIADTDNHRIRRVGPDGKISTVAGTGRSGFSGDGGPAAKAALYAPDDFGIGPDGSIYIADNGNARVRRVWPDGTIRTVAGTGEAGYGGDGGPATQARLHGPTAVVVEADGTYYVADQDNHRIRKVSPDGTITTVAGSGEAGSAGDGGPAVAAQIDEPVDVALYPDGSFLVAEYGGHRIRRVSPDGVITTVVGTGEQGFSGDGGPAAQARLDSPVDVIVGTDGGWFVADGGNQRIRRVGPDGTIATVVGTGDAGGEGDGGPALLATLNAPSEISLGPDGSLYIADSRNDRIRRVAPALAGVAVAVGDVALPSEDGSELFILNASGRHLRTHDTLTGGVRWRFEYDEAGRLAAAVDADGGRTRVERAADGSPAALVAPGGERTLLRVGGDGFLAAAGYAWGAEARCAYAAGGLLTELTDLRGATHRFAYDELGRLARDEGPEGARTDLVRLPTDEGYRVGTVSAEGREAGYRVEDVAGGGRRRVATCCGGGGTTRERAPDGAESTVLPDGSRVSMRTAPDPRFGTDVILPAAMTLETPAGLRSETRLRRTVELRDPSDPLTLSVLADEQEVDGRTSTSRYDAAARELVATTPAGRTRTSRFDARGRLMEVREGAAITLLEHDAEGRLVRMRSGSREQRWTYEGGRVASITDSLGQTVSFSYDALGLPLAQRLPDGRTVGYRYSPAGDLLGVTPPGRPEHTFAYDSVGKVAAWTLPPVDGDGGEVARYERDRDGLPLRTVRPGAEVRFEHDAAGRLAAVHLSRGLMRMEYEENGPRMVRASSPYGSAFELDHDGPLVTGCRWSGAVAGAVAVGYGEGLRTAWLSAGPGPRVELEYDDDGLVVRAGDLRLERDEETGRVTGTELGAVRDRWEHDANGAAIAYTASGPGGTLLEAAWTRDALGRIVRETLSLEGRTRTRGFAYDAAGRLAGVVEDGAERSWEFDANGNRLRARSAAGVEERAYDARDRIASWGAWTFAHTPAGDLARRAGGAGGAVAYDYDEVGNLLAVAVDGAPKVEYVVDGLGRRVGRKVDGRLGRAFLYHDALSPAAELDGTGALVSTFVHATGAGSPDYMVRGGRTYRILADPVGTPLLAVDAETGEVARRMDFDPWGVVTADTAPGFHPFGFAGGLYDEAAGLVRFGARDYDPALGRWTTPDPLGFSGGDTNLYAYRRGDPVNGSDPLGLQSLGDFFTSPEFVNGAVGVADSMSMGIGPLARHAMGTKGVDECSPEYLLANGIANALSLTMGAMRLTYMGALKALPLLRGASAMDRAAKVVRTRNNLKVLFRMGAFPNYRIYSAERMVAKYGGDLDAVVKAATRSDTLLNGMGGSSVARGVWRSLAADDCDCR